MITHDVDEAILLADRILLMSNGSEAAGGYAPGGIAEVVTNTLPRTRTRAGLHHLPGYYELRNHIVDFLVTRARAGAHLNDAYRRPSQMNRNDITEKIIATKVSKGIQWDRRGQARSASPRNGPPPLAWAR